MEEPSNNFFKFNPTSWFIADFDVKKENEIVTWLAVSAVDAWNIGITKIWFRNESDLILFKLRWG